MGKVTAAKFLHSWATMPSTQQDIENQEQSTAYINDVGFSSTQQALKALNEFVLQQSKYDSDLALYMPIRKIRDNEKSSDYRSRHKLRGAPSFHFSLRSSEGMRHVIEPEWEHTKNPFPGLKTPYLNYYLPNGYLSTYVIALAKTTPPPVSMIARWASSEQTLQYFEEEGWVNEFIDWTGLPTIDKALKDFDDCANHHEKFVGEMILHMYYEETHVLPTIEELKYFFKIDMGQSKIYMEPRNDEYCSIEIGDDEIFGITVSANATLIENPFSQQTTNLDYYYDSSFVESQQVYYPQITVVRKGAPLKKLVWKEQTLKHEDNHE
jgi:hypothetical protein